MSVLVKTYRGAVEDLYHHGRVAVCSAEGRLLYSCGDAGRVTFARSSAKPMQAIAVCESGALEHYGVIERELAVMCASHNGEDFHVEAVRGILKKAGLDESYLLCGGAYPIDPQAKLAMQSKGLPPDAVHCDCSGKHSGMLLTAKHYGEDLSSYPQPGHPVQKRIMGIMADVCDYPEEQIVTAIDGCGVPVHAMPLYKLAQGYARMSQPTCFSDKRADAVARITAAMTAHPEMVAGTDRLCTDLMRAFGDRLFSKSGAASFYGIGIKGKGVGIAVKLEDGCSEFMPLVVLRVLNEIGVITWAEAEEKMGKYLDFNIYNHAHTVVGRKELCFHLEEA